MITFHLHQILIPYIQIVLGVDKNDEMQLNMVRSCDKILFCFHILYVLNISSN
jgi:hypothetical protein